MCSAEEAELTRWCLLCGGGRASGSRPSWTEQSEWLYPQTSGSRDTSENCRCWNHTRAVTRSKTHSETLSVIKTCSSLTAGELKMEDLHVTRRFHSPVCQLPFLLYVLSPLYYWWQRQWLLLKRDEKQWVGLAGTNHLSINYNNIV